MAHYLDNAATTPVRQEAARAALEAMTEGWGNPSARYALGTRAAERLKEWRPARGGLFHLLRHGERQLGHPGGGGAEQAEGQAYCHHRH